MGTKGILVEVCQAPNLYSAVTACCSDLTPCLLRRASLSMFISLETRHLFGVRLETVFILFISCFLVVWPGLFFVQNKVEKSLPPTSLIVLANAVLGLDTAAFYVQPLCARASILSLCQTRNSSRNCNWSSFHYTHASS